MELQLADRTIQSFLSALGSRLPAPGGGAAAGLSGALGAALGRMVAELTLGREKYAALSEHAKQASAALEPLIARFADLADADAAAYDGYMAALALPKTTEAEKQTRKAALQQAIHHATKVPCEVIDSAIETVMILEPLYGRSNPTCVGDLAAGAAELECAAKIAWLNILANLPYFSDREEAKTVLREQRTRLEALLERCDALYQMIEVDVRPDFDRQ